MIRTRPAAQQLRSTRHLFNAHHKEFGMRLSGMMQRAVIGASVLIGSVSMGQQQAPPSLQTTLEQSAAARAFTFVVFHRDGGDAARDLARQVEGELKAYPSQAVLATARVDDPAEKILVEKFGIARAPMPMVVVVAPNGAVTGLFPKAMSTEQASAAIVPPTMMKCMKELQDKKLVFVCLTRTDTVEVPAGVGAIQQLPEFKDRVSLVGMRLDDPAESRFHQQLKLDPSQVNGPHAVLIAPPGVLVGHFDAEATSESIAAAIHKAGKCCDDANCKHNKAARAPASGGSRQ
jgi:hypothetical protein